MSNEFKNAGKKVASAMIATGLAAGAALAGMGNTVDVTLPESVTVGKTILPSGSYRIQEVAVGSGESVFLFVDDNGKTAAVTEGLREISPPELNSSGVTDKTEVVLAPREDGTMRLDEMFVEGQSAGYKFANTK